MRRVPLILIAATFLAAALGAAPVPGRAAKSGGSSSTTVRGEIVDLMCYLTDAKKRGRAHEACAREGVAAGHPIGILTRTGQVYLLVARDMKTLREMCEPHAGRQVKVTGRRISRGRMRAILVERVVPVSSTGK